MNAIARILIRHGMDMAIDRQFTHSLITMLNEAQMYDVCIPVPETTRELEMYRLIMHDPRLDGSIRERLQTITTVYDPGGR